MPRFWTDFTPSVFIYQLFWTQACTEGMCTNGTQVPCDNPTTCKGWPLHRGLQPLLFSNSGVGSFTSHKDKSMKVLWDGTYGFSSLSEKTRKSNHLQMSLQRQHFLLSNLKTPSVGPAEVWTHNLPVWNFCCWVPDIPPCETSPSGNEQGKMHNVCFRRLAGNWTVKMSLFFLLLFAMNVVMGYQGFNKGLSRWPKLSSTVIFHNNFTADPIFFFCSYFDRKKHTPVSRAVQAHALPQNFWNLHLLEYISSILEQKLAFLNRTQTSLNFGFFIQRQHMNNIANRSKPLVVSLSVLQNVNHIICKNWSNFQRKVAGKFTWNSLQMSLAAGSYWKLWVNCP